MPAEKTEGTTGPGNFTEIAGTIAARYCAIPGACFGHAVINTIITEIVTETGTNGTITAISHRNKGNGRNRKARFSVTCTNINVQLIKISGVSFARVDHLS